MIYNLYDIQFDNDIDLDDGYRFDNAESTYIFGEVTIDVGFTLIQRFILDLSSTVDVDFIYQGVKGIDLLPLIPRKFHTSQMMVDYIDSVDIGVGGMLQGISDLKNLINPRLINQAYMGYLAALIGTKFIGEDTATTDDLRKQLLDAVAWIKMKGTYGALTFIGYLCNVNVNLYDMYSDAGWSNVVDSSVNQVIDAGNRDVVTEDVTPYVTFVKVPWFVANYEEENPSGVASTYFKTPHFGFEVEFNNYITPSISDWSAAVTYSTDSVVSLYSSDGNTWRSLQDSNFNHAPYENGWWTIANTKYLWHDSMFPKIAEAIEQVRPINTVPHISGLLVAQTKEDSLVQTIVETNVSAVITNNWTYSAWRFDESPVPIRFNDGRYFDTSASAFINAITEFRVGTGHKDQSPTTTGFTLDTLVYTGTVTSQTITASGYVFEFTIPAVQAFTGLSELTLNLIDHTIVLACTFPDTDKTAGMELNFKVTVTLS